MGYLLFKTDTHHSHQSKELIGVFTEYGKLMSAAGRFIKQKSKEEFSDREYDNWNDMYDEELDLLIRIKQTQGFSENLIFEEIKFNKILKP